MVFKVAELVATLRLDKDSYDSGLSESRAKMADLGTQAQSTGSSLGGALTGGMRAASAAAVGLGIAAGVTLKTVLDTGLAYNGLQQTSRAALRTLLGGAEAANAQMDKLDAFAKTSPFSKSVFIQAQQQLIGFGAEAGKVIPMLSSINDAVAAIGGSNDDIAGISSSLAKVIGTGKLTGDTLNELGERGINAAQILADGFGVSAEAIHKQIEKGTLDSAKALDILVAGMSEKYAGAAANVKETIEGARDRVTAATRDIGAALAEPFVSKNGGGRLVQWSNDWADALRSIEKRVPSVVSMFQDRLSPQLAGVSVLIGKLKTAVVSFDLSKLSTGLDHMGDNLPVVAGLAGAVVGLSGGFLSAVPVVGGFLAKLNPLALALTGAAAASPELRAAIGDLVLQLAPLLPAIGQLAGALSGALTDAVGAAVPLVGGLGDVLGVLANFIAPILVSISGLASGFSDLPGPVQTVMTALGLLLLFRPKLTTAFQAVGTAATNMGTQLAGASVKGALTGLLGAFGGPWGLAVGAAVVGLSMFAAENQKTKDRVQEFTDSLDQNTGAITKNTSVTAGKKLQEYSETLKSIKLNAKDASDAIANGGAPYSAMVQKVDKLRQAILNYNTTAGNASQHQAAKEALIQLAAGYDINAEAATKLNSGALSQLLGGMTTMRGEVIETSEGWKTLHLATEKTEPTTLRLSDAIKKVGDSSADTSERLRAYQDVIDAMNGKTKTVEQTQRDLSKSSRDLAGFFNEVDANGQKVNASLSLAADGTVQFNDAGDRLSGMLDGLAQKGQTAALAAADLAKAQGRGSQAAADADAALKPYRDSLQRLADTGVLTQTQVDALSKSLFGIPGSTSLVVTDGDTAAATKLKVDELTRSVQATPNKEIIITEPLSPAVMEKLAALGFKVTSLPDGKIRVTETGTDATGAKIDGAAGKQRWARIDVDAPSVAAVSAAIDNAARRREAYIAVVYRDNGAPAAPVHGGPQVAQQANGGLLDFYANGGLRELNPMKPLAQIVPQNTWRVVGDNMKVPELYAPLDGSARSLSLMQEGARRMGFNMVPRNAVNYFAEGGFSGATPARAPAAVATSEPARRGGATYQFTGPVTVTNQAEFESMTRQRASDRNAALGISAIEREL